MIYNNEPAYIEYELRQTLRHKYGFEEVELYSINSGMNNITRNVKHRNDYFNVRVYCNHQDEAKVKFEHDILLELNKAQLAIQIPMPVMTLDGTYIAYLSDGRLVALYHFIEGTQQAKLQYYNKLIAASAHLSSALASIHVSEDGEYGPYYDIKKNYDSYSVEQIYAWADHYSFDKDITHKLIFLNEKRIWLEQQYDYFTKLPHQYIHGDINFSNAVVKDDNVIAIIDFEFVTYDLRAMELAILLTEYFSFHSKIDQHSFMEYIHTFHTIRPLTAEEFYVLPALVQLRAVDVVIHFFGRFLSGIDSYTVLKRMVNNSYRYVELIQSVQLKWEDI